MRAILLSIFGAVLLSLMSGCGASSSSGNRVEMPKNPAPPPTSPPMTSSSAASDPSKAVHMDSPPPVPPPPKRHRQK
jgi:hypothetical protein